MLIIFSPIRAVSLKSCLFTPLFCLFLLTAPAESFAIIVDNFETLHPEVAVTPGQNPNPSSSSIQDILPFQEVGGTRTIRVEATGVNPVRAKVESGYFQYAEDVPPATGKVTIIWDGDTDNNLNRTGLGGIDFKQDGSTKFILKDFTHDLSLAQGAFTKLTIKVYSSPSSFSRIERTYAGEINIPQDEEFLFDQFAIDPGALTGANFNSIGAIELIVDAANANAVDMGFSSFRTDQCGRVPDTNKKVLYPEVCDNYDNDCDNLVDEDFPLKNATCSVGTAPCLVSGTYVCSQAGALTCNGSVEEAQACEATKGCDGQPASGKVRDVCGVCGGNGSSCLGCDNKPNSGLLNDICSVCGGNGKSCLDCNGQAFGTAKLDRCGICEGDGNSCIKCIETDLSPIFKAMDGGAKEQEAVVRQLLNRISTTRYGKKVSTKKYISETLQLARELQILNWILSWTTMPINNRQCDNSALCTTISNVKYLDEYRNRTGELSALALKAASQLKKARGGKLTASDLKVRRAIDSAYKKCIEASNQAAKTHVTCDPSDTNFKANPI